MSEVKRKGIYESRGQIESLSELRADLMNFVAKNQWELTHNFRERNLGFYFGCRLVFGINLHAQTSRLCIWMPKDDVQEYFQRFFENDLLFLDDRSKAFFIIGCKKEADIRDPKGWLNQFEWLCTNLEELNKVFLPSLGVTQYYEETLLQG